MGREAGPSLPIIQPVILWLQPIAPLMSTTTPRRLVNPLLGAYFGIFVSVMASLVLMVLIFELLGVTGPLLRMSMLLVPLALYVVIGVATATSEPQEFFAAGRRVPAVYTGLTIAGSAVGATGLVAMTGLFFINGFDAWCVSIGLVAGFVATALLVAPYLRKFGAFTVPSYLGRRFESRLLRLAAAATMLVPMVLIAAAEFKMGAAAGAWLSGMPASVAAVMLCAVLIFTVVFGGMRALTWTNTAQVIAALLAMVVPVAIVAVLETNLPLPQFTHGPVLRGIGRLEAMQGVPMPIAPPLALDFAGQELRALGHRMAQPYASVGPLAFILLSLSLLCGVAASPWLLPRSGCTPGVYATRKAGAWAIVFCGLVMLTAASVAVFVRFYVMHEVVGQNPGNLPQWFQQLQRLGLAEVVSQGSPARLAVTDLAFTRDGVLFALPIAAGFPEVVLLMALTGVIAIALLGASAAVVGIGNVMAEDGVGGLVAEPPAAPLRLSIARISAVVVAIVTCWIAIFIPSDPFQLMLWGLALSASAGFPVIVLSIWWKRLNAVGAAAGIVVGFGVAVLAILGAEAGWLGLPSVLAATLGVPAGFAGAVLIGYAFPGPDRIVLERVRAMRLPGGETMEDRESRMLRLKERRGPSQ